MIIPFSKHKTEIKCKGCDKSLFVRNDYLNKHSGYCHSCAKKRHWEDESYRRKCSDSHKGKRSHRALPYGESNFNNLFYSYNKNAEYRGVPFQLTKEDFRHLTVQNCYYCDAAPSQVYGSKTTSFNGYWIHNGVDRKNDALGYSLDNCVPCCKVCNYAKQGLSDTEFIEHIAKIYRNHYEIDTVGSRQKVIK